MSQKVRALGNCLCCLGHSSLLFTNLDYTNTILEHVDTYYVRYKNKDETVLCSFYPIFGVIEICPGIFVCAWETPLYFEIILNLMQLKMKIIFIPCGDKICVVNAHKRPKSPSTTHPPNVTASSH